MERHDCASAIPRRRRGRHRCRCAMRRPISSRAIQAFGNTNWLGLDNQGRDVLARVIYGFRISVLFGLLLTILSSAVGVLGRRGAGLLRRHAPTSSSSASWKSGTRSPNCSCCSSSRRCSCPGFWTLLGILLLFSWTSLVGVVRAEFLRGRNLEYVRAARALGPHRLADHVQASAAQRHGGDADLPAVQAFGRASRR